MATPKAVRDLSFDAIPVQTFTACGAAFADADGPAVVCAAHDIQMSLRGKQFDPSHETLTAETALMGTTGHTAHHHLRGQVNCVIALVRATLQKTPRARK